MSEWGDYGDSAIAFAVDGENSTDKKPEPTLGARIWRWLRRETDRRTWELRAARDGSGFLTDGFLRPSIGVVGGWILGGLFGLVLWLTFRWAPLAAERAKNAPDAIADAITPEGGWTAIVIVALLALAAGWEQMIEALFDGVRRPKLRVRRPDALRYGIAGKSVEWSEAVAYYGVAAVRWVWSGVKLLARIPSRMLSVADWLLAKMFACAAGAHRVGRARRYAVFALWIGGAFCAGLYLRPNSDAAALLGLPEGTALILLSFVMLCIIGVARRWSWVEQDRDAFLITRSEEPRPLGQIEDDAPVPVRRIGFREDLRDQAITGLVCLFALIPLALMHIELLNPGTFAFGEEPDRPLVFLGYQFGRDWTLHSVFGPTTSDNPLVWYGYFGAELAKSVPFVDWSEVFHVPNGTPISPATPAGSSIVFALRAGLDLLVLAAVLQALSIAGRTRQVRAAFAGRLIDVLDPFDERLYFARAERRRAASAGAREIDQPGVRAFTPFDRKRLLKRASGRDEDARPGRRSMTAQRAMMSVAARQIGSDPAQFPDDAVEALAERLERARTPQIQMHALELFGELGRLNEPQKKRMAAAALKAMMDAKRRPDVRAFAARELGRLRYAPAADALTAVAFASDASEIGAAATVSLAALRDRRAAPLAEAFPEDGLLGAMRLHALDLLDGANRLPIPIMARVPGGRFIMGGADHPEEGGANDLPRHVRRIPNFSIGRASVAFAQYDAYCRFAGAPPADDNGWGRDQAPLINVSWFEAQRYAAWLRLVTGQRWRLPSEAEWEYACRAGSDAAYAFGEDPSDLPQHGWFDRNSHGRARPVAELRANDFGLFDMHGNVWEWCQDQWRDNYLGAPNDESAWISSRDTAVRRGGSWYDAAEGCRASDRLWARRGHRSVTVGFRLAYASTG